MGRSEEDTSFIPPQILTLLTVDILWPIPEITSAYTATTFLSFDRDYFTNLFKK